MIAAAALDAMHGELADARHSASRESIGAGHSEGAVVVSAASRLDRAGARLDGVVLLAGPSVGIL